MSAPTGTTRLAAVIGSPISHSLSPVLLNAAFSAAGVDWVDVALEVAPGDAQRAFEGIRALGISGVSVTTPHKEAAATLCDRLSPDAERLGAVNCVHNVDGVLTGHTTDGVGFVSSIAADHGFDPSGRDCVVVGAGGAARSIVLALVRAGSSSVVIVNRTVENAERLAASVGGSASHRSLADAGPAISAAALVINATSVGMGAPDPAAMPFDVADLHEGQLVVDIVYRPLETPLLRAAAGRGAITANGVSMLAHQAARQFEIWTGLDAPVDAMLAAVSSHLGG